MQNDSAINHGPHVVKIAIQRERGSSFRRSDIVRTWLTGLSAANLVQSGPFWMLARIRVLKESSRELDIQSAVSSVTAPSLVVSWTLQEVGFAGWRGGCSVTFSCCCLPGMRSGAKLV